MKLTLLMCQILCLIGLTFQRLCLQIAVPIDLLGSCYISVSIEMICELYKNKKK